MIIYRYFLQEDREFKKKMKIFTIIRFINIIRLYNCIISIFMDHNEKNNLTN